MIPIHELLNRIRWDPEFAKGNFELGYHDRTENRIILVPKSAEAKEIQTSSEL